MKFFSTSQLNAHEFNKKNVIFVESGEKKKNLEHVKLNCNLIKVRQRGDKRQEVFCYKKKQ